MERASRGGGPPVPRGQRACEGFGWAAPCTEGMEVCRGQRGVETVGSDAVRQTRNGQRTLTAACGRDAHDSLVATMLPPYAEATKAKAVAKATTTCKRPTRAGGACGSEASGAGTHGHRITAAHGRDAS